MLQTTLSPFRARAASQFPTTIRSTVRSKLTLTKTPLQTLTRRTLTTSRPSASPNFSTNFTFTSHSRSASSLPNQTLLQRLRTLRFFSRSRAKLNSKPTSPNPTPNLNSPGVEAETQTLSGKLKRLSREYGWSAVGVYLALSALDFPFCYLLVRELGTERIGKWEHAVVSSVKAAIPESFQQKWHDWRASMKKTEQGVAGEDHVSEGVEMAGWGVEEADERHKRDASLATQLALAYAIHKSFIFIRVPLTAAVTPKVVKILRGWGWDIGKRTTKEAKAIKRAIIPKN